MKRRERGRGEKGRERHRQRQRERVRKKGIYIYRERERERRNGERRKKEGKRGRQHKTYRVSTEVSRELHVKIRANYSFNVVYLLQNEWTCNSVCWHSYVSANKKLEPNHLPVDFPFSLVT